VIVKDRRVISEDYHAQFGGPHAEPAALAHCTESPAGATAYVTLEPCCHTNKKTPPCVPRLIEAKLARVVIGCLDPNPDVNGKGVAMLRTAGIQVDGPVLEKPAKQLIAPFLARVTHQRPYVTLKWAQTADRKVAGPQGGRIQISSNESTQRVHELRARSDGILVGIRTVLNDDPLLTARGVADPRPLTRIVLDSELRFETTCSMVPRPGTGQVILCCADDAYAERGNRFLQLFSGDGLSLLPVPRDPRGGLLLNHVLAALGRTTMTHLLVEPGPLTADSFIRDNLTDRIWVFRSPDCLREASAPAAANVTYPAAGQMASGRDTLTEYLNPASPVFFAAEPSADFVLAGESANQ
jgi:diaminohydroxyphosphoribosylaminopyrimidine deaminase/5-amino-6-(5-phosphoribosylamino)uracil reductase